MAADVVVPRWHACVCPYPKCDGILTRASPATVTVSGVLEFRCRKCLRRSILGGPDLETPSRPQVLILREARSETELAELRRARRRGQTTS